MIRNVGRKARVRINVSDTATNTQLLAAPTDGSHYELDFVSIMPTGGANTVSLKDGTTVMFSYALDDNQAFTFDNASGDYPIELTSNTALNIQLTTATQVDGFILYRAVGEA